ncbi:ribonuclease H-like domain-containing protein [Fusibacter bizertensis]
MEKIIYQIETPIHYHFSKYNIMFIDIETDGLSHKNRIAIIGLIIFIKHNNTPIVIQLFNDDYHSEKDLLIELADLIREYNIDYYVSFNGNSFDFPFINARFMHYKIDFVLTKSANIDLYRLVKQNQDFLNLPDSKLKTVEKFVGIERTDTISGKDSIILYEAFLETKSLKLKNSILLHNYDDIINMIPLLKLLDTIDYVPPYYFEYRKFKFYLTSIKLKGNFLHCQLSVNELYSIKDLYHTIHGSYFEFSGLTLNIKFELISLSDPKGNLFMFMNPDLIYGKTIYQCNEEEKHMLLAAYNHSCYDDSIQSYLTFAVIKILKLLDSFESE